MMTASGQNLHIKESLRRILSRGGSTQTAPGETDPGVAQTLAEKLAVSFSKYSAGTGCTPKVSTRCVTDDDQPASIVTLVFTVNESGINAWVELPAALIKSLFVASLGGVPSVAAFLPNDPLTKIEQRFMAIVANDVADALPFPSGQAVLASIFCPGDTEPPRKPDGLETVSVLVSVDGVDVAVSIHLPQSKNPPETVQAEVSTLAGTTQRLFVEPEIRLRLREMAMSDIANMKQGDILSVAPESNGPAAYLSVRGNAVMACELGQMGSRYSARVIGPLAASAGQKSTILDKGGL